MYPLMLLVGEAGSGKDTVAQILAEDHGAVTVAQADPMKRLARVLFDFTEDQLWGPSESRNAIDPRWVGDRGLDAWEEVLGGWSWAYGLGGESQSITAQAKALPLCEVIRDISSRGGIDTRVLGRGVDRWLQGLKNVHPEGLTPRVVLQTLGTECGRALKRDLWVDYSHNVAHVLLNNSFGYTASDGLRATTGSEPPPWVVVTDGRFRNEVVAVLARGGLVVRVENPRTEDTEGRRQAVESAGVRGHASEAEQRGLPAHLFSARILNDKTQGLQALRDRVGALMRSLDYPLGTF